MAAPTETYIDPAVAGGNDFGGAGFVDGAFANATNTLTKVGAFPAVTNIAGDKIYLTDNGSAEVTAGLYTIVTRTSDDAVVLSADIRSGGNDPSDVVCVLHDGTINLEWATVQHALNFTTRDAVNGDRMNIMAGTDDVLAAALVLTTYGVPALGIPLIFQGYTAAAGDRGIGGIDGAGSFGIFADTGLDAIGLIDLHLHNSGAANIVHLDNDTYAENCEIDNTTGSGIYLDNDATVINCYIHNCDAYGIRFGQRGVAWGNHLENGANDFVIGIYASSVNSVASFNTLDIDGTTDGISIAGARQNVYDNNTIYSNAGSGTGIDVLANTPVLSMRNNYIEGFSAGGGIGIQLAATSALWLYGHNKFYNNNDDESLNGDIFQNVGNNDLLGSSGLTNPGADNFTADTDLKALGYPTGNNQGLAVRTYLDVGALQREEAGGGGTTVGGGFPRGIGMHVG